MEAVGKAAHGSRFFEGIDANMRMGRFLGRLDLLEHELRARPAHPLVGPPSLHAPLLRGGTELSTYAASCRLGIERRTVPGETEPSVQAEIEALIDQTASADPSFHATVRCLLARNAFEVSPDAAILHAVRTAATRHLGKSPALIGKPFWMDSAILADAGVETVIIGPIGAGAHTAEEWVDLQSLEPVRRRAPSLAPTLEGGLGRVGGGTTPDSRRPPPHCIATVASGAKVVCNTRTRSFSATTSYCEEATLEGSCAAAGRWRAAGSA